MTITNFILTKWYVKGVSTSIPTPTPLNFILTKWYVKIGSSKKLAKNSAKVLY
ncbi:TPA: hypothetical protein KN086_003983 [Clostridioides difficile]|nr:hypothetical protein [Clostridioides difficile]